MLEWNVPGGFLSVRSGKPDMASKYRSVELAKLKLTALFSVRRQTTLYSNSVSCTSGSQRRDFCFFSFTFSWAHTEKSIGTLQQRALYLSPAYV